MNTRKKTQFMTMTALLTAIAILIPIVMPFKIVIPPASYTLGSHIYFGEPHRYFYSHVLVALDGSFCHPSL